MESYSNTIVGQAGPFPVEQIFYLSINMQSEMFYPSMERFYVVSFTRLLTGEWDHHLGSTEP
jgi:hypothetical protein